MLGLELRADHQVLSFLSVSFVRQHDSGQLILATILALSGGVAHMGRASGGRSVACLKSWWVVSQAYVFTLLAFGFIGTAVPSVA